MDDAQGTGLATGPKPMPTGRPFPKGVSGNPSGRASGKRLRRQLKPLLHDAWVALREHVNMAEDPPIRQRAAEFIVTNFYGKPVERHELSGANGEALKVTISINL